MDATCTAVAAFIADAVSSTHISAMEVVGFDNKLKALEVVNKTGRAQHMDSWAVEYDGGELYTLSCDEEIGPGETVYITHSVAKKWKDIVHCMVPANLKKIMLLHKVEELHAVDEDSAESEEPMEPVKAHAFNNRASKNKNPEKRETWLEKASPARAKPLSIVRMSGKESRGFVQMIEDNPWDLTITLTDAHDQRIIVRNMKTSRVNLKGWSLVSKSMDEALFFDDDFFLEAEDFVVFRSFETAGKAYKDEIVWPAPGLFQYGIDVFQLVSPQQKIVTQMTVNLMNPDVPIVECIIPSQNQSGMERIVPESTIGLGHLTPIPTRSFFRL